LVRETLAEPSPQWSDIDEACLNLSAHHHLIASPTTVLDRIESFSRGTSCGRDRLRAQHLIDCLSGATIAIYDYLVSSITQVLNLFLDAKCLKIMGISSGYNFST
nr:hypothetical protein [Tanacetum cinerariifolium]